MYWSKSYTQKLKSYAYRKYKNKLNLTIDDTVVEKARRFAVKKQSSISQLVKQYFKSLTRSARRSTILEMVKKLPKPAINVNRNLEEAYYEDQKKKYGF